MIRSRDRKKYLIPLCFFLVGVILRCFMGAYLKTPTVYWDELKYYGIARSLFRGLGLTVRNVDTNFQKILYSLVLCPFFAIDDPAVRVRMMTLLNAILINSCIFPMWMLCTHLGVERKRILWLSAMLVLWPDMLLSVTFMSENLYWPLFFWYIVLHFCRNGDDPLRTGLLEGILMYVGYLCKEVFASFPAVTALTLLLETKLCPREKDDMRRQWRRFLFSALCFGVLFILGKLTVFRGSGRGYDQSDPSVLFTSSGPVYLIYSVGYLLVSAILSVQLLPFAVPLLRFRQLRRDQRQFLLYIMVFIIFTVCGIAYSISVREDAGNMIPRIHLRYLAPAAFLLLPVLALCPQRPESAKKDTDTAVLLGFAILVLALFRSSDGFPIDQTTLQWVNGFNGLLNKFSDNSSYVFWALQVLEIVLCLSVSIGIYLYFSGRGKDFLRPFFIFLLLISLVSNTVGHCAMKEKFSADAGEYDSVIKLSETFSQRKGNLLYLTDTYDQCRNSKVWDCCFEPVEKVYYFIYSYFELSPEELILDGGIYKKPAFDPDARVSDLEFTSYVDEGYYSTTDRIDYVVIPGAAHLTPSEASSLELIDGLSDSYYSVYRNTEPEALDLTAIVYTGDPAERRK